MVYVQTRKLPAEERYELSSQMRRAATSVPSNIAEGQARSSTKEFLNFLSIANGSIAELQTQMLLCVRIGYLTNDYIEKVMEMSYEVSKMIASLRASLEAKLD